MRKMLLRCSDFGFAQAELMPRAEGTAVLSRSATERGANRARRVLTGGAPAFSESGAQPC